MKEVQDVFTEDIADEKAAKEQKRLKQRRIEMAIIIPLIVLIVGGSIFGTVYIFYNGLQGFAAMAKLGFLMGEEYKKISDKKVKETYYDNGTWEYTLYTKGSDPDYAHIEITNLSLRIGNKKELILPREIEGYRVKRLTLEENVDYDGKIFVDLYYYGILGVGKSFQNCDVIIVGNFDLLSGSRITETFYYANNIYINDVLYPVLQELDIEFCENTNISKANVSYILNYEYEGGKYCEDYYYYIENAEDRAKAEIEIESAQSDEEEETIFLKYNGKRVYLSDYNNGYYWIDNLKYGDKIITKPEDPTREGYTFAGWYLDKEGTQEFDFDTFVKSDEDLVLYAKWIKNN